MRKGKDPEPDSYLLLMDPDLGRPKNMRIRIPDTEFTSMWMKTIFSFTAHVSKWRRRGLHDKQAEAGLRLRVHQQATENVPG